MIDLDQNATTAVDPRVLEAMARCWRSGGNAESRHAAGRAARRELDRAREGVARVLGAEPGEVVFTSGGTEANNLAVFGLAREEAGLGTIVTSVLEHPAVAGPVEDLERRGFAVVRAGVRPDGVVDLGGMAAGLTGRTRLAALMLAQNETGAIQPVGELAARAAEHEVLVHTDAAQAVGRIAVNFHGLGVATLAASAHKCHGPAGVGVLLVRRGVKLAPRLLGGGQQGGLRPGTVPVALAVGMATALELWEQEAAERTARWRRLSGRLERGLVDTLGANVAVVQGPVDPERRLPQTVQVGFAGLDGDALLMQLDLAGVCVSLGSACASGSTQPSPVLVAMGVPPERLRSSVRFSFGAGTTEAEVDETVRRVAAVVGRIRGGS